MATKGPSGPAGEVGASEPAGAAAPADWLARVRAWYDRDPEFEWRRLDWRVQYRIEHLVTWHALARRLPPPGCRGQVRVLDAGGGPGRYTVALAERGYRVTLLDLSLGNVALARRKVAAAGPAVAARVEACVEGSFTDLSAFPAARFDAVLCLGAAFSHVVDAAARTRALAELRRVARPGAPLFVSALNRLAAYRSVVQWPDTWDKHFPAGLAAFAATGCAGTEDWPCYAFLPEEFAALLEAAGLERLALYGAQGIAAHLPPEHLEALMADRRRWPVWRALLLATCDHPNVVGVSSHLLAVARRPPASRHPRGAPYALPRRSCVPLDRRCGYQRPTGLPHPRLGPRTTGAVWPPRVPMTVYRQEVPDVTTPPDPTTPPAGPANAAGPAIPASHRALLDAPVGVLATLGPDGLPQATAVWFLYDADAGVVRFSLTTARQKTKNLRARPGAAFLVLDPATPYRTLELRGRTQLELDDDYAFAARLGQKYGADLRQTDGPGVRRVVVTLRPTKVNTWGE